MYVVIFNFWTYQSRSETEFKIALEKNHSARLCLSL